MTLLWECQNKWEIFQKILAFSENLNFKDQKCLLIKDDAVTPQELVKTSNQEIVLIVLDGTWREAKKMYSWSPPLQNLPKMKLDVDLKSQYVVKTQPNDKVGDIPSSFKNLKGQLISKCLIGSIVSTKKPTKFF